VSPASCVLFLRVTSPTSDITKVQLENGLTVLILEKHEIPIVTSTIWYHVGSAYETQGQTGISHLLEHLMFKGTRSYPKGMIDAMTAAYGGYNNAGTIFDFTMYYFNFSSDRWELALEIEADRMQHCLFDEDEFEAERHVVLEELKQQKDSPWGELAVQIEAAMFPAHPYHHPVIGWQADLEQISRDAVVNYYATYYVPNNATIVIVGDVTASDAIGKVRHSFAHIPANLHLPTLVVPDIRQDTEQRLTVYQDSSVKRLQIGYHATVLSHEDIPALDVLDHVLSHGKTSRLYQRLVEHDRLVNFVDSYHHPRKFRGVFYLFAVLHPGVTPDTVERIVDEELERLHRTLIPDEELQKAKNVIAADFIFEKETTSGLAHALGEYAVLSSYEDIQTYAGRIAQVTTNDVMRAAQTYLVRANRTVGWAFPHDPERELAQGGVSDELLPPPVTDMVFYKPPNNQHSGLHGRREVFENRPSTTGPEIFSPERHQFRHHRWMLENGLIVLFLEQHALPVLSIDAFVEAGQRYESDEQAGVAILTGQLLDEGTTSRSSFEIAHAIESVGGSLDTQSQGASVQVLSKDVGLAMDILADVLIHPVFDPQQLEKKRQRLLGSLEEDDDHLSLLSFNLFRELAYGSHPYHRPRKGYKQTVSALSRNDVLTHYRSYFRPDNTILSIAGDVEPDRMLDEVRRKFDQWECRESPPRKDYDFPVPQGCTRKHLERNREQVHLYLGHLGVTRTNPDFYALLVMDHILGVSSGFTDRISRRLRDEEGLAYSVGANISLSAEKEPGLFTAYIGTSPENVERALTGFWEEISRIRTEPVSQEELELAQNYITGSYVFNFETSAQLTRYLINVERYHLGEHFLWDLPHLIQNIGIDDIQRVARQYLDPENYYITSAGNMQELS